MRMLRLLMLLPSRLAIALAPILRLLAALFLLLAVVLFFAGTAGSGVGSSTAAHWQAVSPSSYAAFAASVTRNLGAWVWNPMLSSILALPAYVLFGFLAVILGFAGRRRRVVNVYVN